MIDDVIEMKNTPAWGRPNIINLVKIAPKARKIMTPPLEILLHDKILGGGWEGDIDSRKFSKNSLWRLLPVV